MCVFGLLTLDQFSQLRTGNCSESVMWNKILNLRLVGFIFSPSGWILVIQQSLKEMKTHFNLLIWTQEETGLLTYDLFGMIKEILALNSDLVVYWVTASTSIVTLYCCKVRHFTGSQSQKYSTNEILHNHHAQQTSYVLKVSPLCVVVFHSSCTILFQSYVQVHTEGQGMLDLVNWRHDIIKEEIQASPRAVPLEAPQ